MAVLAVLACAVPSIGAESLQDDGGHLDRFAFYLAVGPVRGPGKVLQVDRHGEVVSSIDLPATPYGVAIHDDRVHLALPSAGSVAQVDRTGNVVLKKLALIPHPIDVAVRSTSGEVFNSDNLADRILSERSSEWTISSK